ncbi:hypothetical protein [Calidifontibacter terrae]
MPATLHIHREFASPERVVCLGDTVIGTLADDDSVFEIPVGKHFVILQLGRFRSTPHLIRAFDGAEIHLHVEEDPEAKVPLLQGGFVRLRETPA